MTTTSALHFTGPSSTPAPVSWPPSGNWDGDDGSWSSFALRVGDPAQIVRVLISTAGYNTWVVQPEGCPPGTHGITSTLTCAQSRGELYDSSLSTTSSILGNYSLGIEGNLGYDSIANYGLETVALGFNNGTGGPTLQGQVVAGLETYNFYNGLFGLGNQPSNFTASNDTFNLTDTKPYPSFLTTMRNQNLIPSLSWAYTAGAIYRNKGVLGSLTFGGYDLSRLVSNNVTFNLAPDISRDLVVGLQSIASTEGNGVTVSLLSTPILTFIDSTVPFIYLPLDACTAFENAFGLTYNATTKLYPVNDTLHQSLTARNPNFTFQIGNGKTGGPTVDIVLPYASFDLLASYPRVSNATRYFPLRRAANDSQNTLGRTFLQEAYIIANYEYSNFSVSQARFDDGLPEDIIAIPSAHPPPTTKSHTLISRNSIIGLVVGLTASLVFTILLIIYTRKRLRKKSQKDEINQMIGSPRSSQDVKPHHISGVHEADNNDFYGLREFPDTGKVELLDRNAPSGSGNKILEMPQSPSPAPLCELGTRHTSIATASLRRESDKNRATNIIVSTSISQRETSHSSSDSNESPRIETRISSSPEKPPPPLVPGRPLAMPRRMTLKEYLDRDLPSTPDSDSTQTSRTKTGYSTPASAAHRFRAHSNRTSATTMETSPPSPSALDLIMDEYDMSWGSPSNHHHHRHRRPPEPSIFSSASTDIKIMMPPEVVGRRTHGYQPSMSSLSLSSDVGIIGPPGTPNISTPSSARSRERGGQRMRGGFF